MVVTVPSGLTTLAIELRGADAADDVDDNDDTDDEPDHVVVVVVWFVGKP